MEPETPLIQIRAAASLMELDPLQDNSMGSYREEKQDEEETEVNFGVLKSESIEVIDVEEKDDGGHLVQDMNQISELLEDVDSDPREHDNLPSSCFSLPQTTTDSDSAYDVPQSRGTNRGIVSILAPGQEGYSDGEDGPTGIKGTKKRGKSKIYMIEKSFPCFEEAEIAVKAETCWSRVSNKLTYEGRKIIYRCNKGPYRCEKTCPAAVYLLLHSNSQKVTLYRSLDEHDYDTHITSRGLEAHVKDEIQKLVSFGVKKPKAIQETLLRRGFENPPLPQLTNYLATLRKQCEQQQK
jgi:hypothetical protein